MNRFTRLLLLSVFVLTTEFAAIAEVSQQQAAAVDSLFAEWANADSPGAAVGVVRDGELIFAKGYGTADLEHDVPITPQTVFYAASVSKQFVTMAIMLLEEKGALDLDAPIQTYLPDFPVYEAPLTIRHFIHHTSGVRDSLELWILSGRDIYDYVPKDSMYALIKRQKSLNFTPGDQYLYSNACYFMLAMIVEAVSDQSIKDFTEENMFGPLGMHNTHFHDDMYHLVKNRAFSYAKDADSYKNIIMRFDLVGSGGLYTNIEDLALWDRNFDNNVLGDADPALIEEMQTDGTLNNGESAGYAFGLRNDSHRGLATVGHGGSLAGYRTHFIRYPAQNFSVIVLANVAGFDAGGQARRVAEVFLAEAFPEDPSSDATVSASESHADSQEETENYTAAELARFVGRFYSDEVDAYYEIAVDDTALTLSIAGRHVGVLSPMQGGKFVVEGMGTLEFAMEDRSDIDSFTVDVGRVRELRFDRQ